MIKALPTAAALAIISPFSGPIGSASAQDLKGPSIPKFEVRPRPAVTDKSTFPLEAGKFTILGIQADIMDMARAKELASDTLAKHPDIAGMVGLWAYHAPLILHSVREAKLAGKVKIISFDEDRATIEGIASEEIHGTVVQQPFLLGYRSAELLSAMVRGKAIHKDGKPVHIPVKVVKKDNVAQFRASIISIEEGAAVDPPPLFDDYPDPKKRVKVVFAANGIAHYWEMARLGFEQGAKKFNVDPVFITPPDSTVNVQNRLILKQVTEGAQAFAISPIDATAQKELLTGLALKMPLICQDADAPDTGRRFFLGTSNYHAGREAGKLIKEALPDGGEIMLFVGRLVGPSATDRSQGIVDELLDLPLPE